MPLEERIKKVKELRKRTMDLYILNSSDTNSYKMKMLISNISYFITMNNTLPEDKRLEIPSNFSKVMKLNV